MTSTRPYLLTLAALLALSALTFGLSFVPLGAFGVLVALAIAATKAGLVAMFFMHLRERTAGDSAALLLGIFFAVLLIGLATLDVATRPQVPIAAGAQAQGSGLKANAIHDEGSPEP